MSPFEISLLGGMLYGLGFMPPFPDPFQSLSLILRLSVAGVGFAQLIRAQRDSLTPKSSFASGFAFGFGFISVSLFGIYSSFAVVKQLLFFPPCLAFLGALWGSLLGGLMALCRFVLIPSPLPSFEPPEDSPAFPSFAFAVSGAWFLFELLRGIVEPFAFPWNLTAHLFCFENMGVTQLVTAIVRPFGVYILSWVFAFAFAIFLGRASKIFRSSVFAILGSVGFYGAVSIIQDVSRENFLSPLVESKGPENVSREKPPAHSTTSSSASENVSRENNSHERWAVRLLLIQPHISQRDKLCRDAAEEILQKTERLTREALTKTGHKVDGIVWPETAIHGAIREDLPILERLKDSLPDDETFLVFGADRLASRQGAASIVWHNSLFVLSRNGLEGIYDKRFLLPFGEYVPLRRFFPKFFNKVLGGIDCTPGTRTGALQIGDLPLFAPKICSETMFGLSSSPGKRHGKWARFFQKVSRENFLPPLDGEGENVSRENNPQPKFVLSIANDGWFSAPILWQHLAVDRLRAIEARLPLVRTTNTGITALIAPNGTVEQQIPAQKEGFLEVVLTP